MTTLPLGNDGIFSLFLYYKSTDVIGNLGEPVASSERRAVNLSEVENITVKVRNKYTGLTADVPYRISREAVNLIEVELPVEKQQKGEYSVTVDFDIPTERLEDKALHRRVEVTLCNVVETTRLTGREEYVVMSADVLPLVRGRQGDKGKDAEIPRFSLKKDPSNGKTYMAIGDDYLRDENGERVFLQREVANTIDYLPVIDLKPVVTDDWSKGYFYGYMESDREKFKDVFVTLSSVPEIGNWARSNYILTTPYHGMLKNGFYPYGFYTTFLPCSSQPIANSMKQEFRSYALVIRIKTFCNGRVSMRNNCDIVSIQTETDVFYDLAIPMRLHASETKLEVVTPSAPYPGQPSFVISDIKFVEITPGETFGDNVPLPLP